MSTRKKVALHSKILIGLAVGMLFGILANLLGARNPVFNRFLNETLIKYITGPIGRIFLNLLFMTVVPLVFSTLTVGITNLGDMRRLGRIGMKTFAMFLVLTALSTLLGMSSVSLLKPGEGFDPATQVRLLETYRGEIAQRSESFKERGGFGVDTFINIIPRNPLAAMVNMDMLAVIFFALLFGAALTLVRSDKTALVTGALEVTSEAMIKIVGFAMSLAPIAVPALIFNVVARFGTDLLEKLLYFVLITLGGYLIFLFGVYTLLLFFVCRVRPLEFFRRIIPIMVTAFSTSSSNATLPTTLKESEERLGIPADIAGFVLPLGATMNMNGTALYEGVTVLFLAQVFGLHLSIGSMAIVVILSVLMAVGTAGIPGASLPMLMMVLNAVGVPPEGIAIILGMDRILDMGRTMLNVTGDVVTAAYVTRSEGLAPAGAGSVFMAS
ncbi:MAG TPA: dicarboxylate/amino acid:cation symporter [bacterium]|nr:dicarboxylate/amino acid:cation symporter [bacterium]HQI49157.1 dicarboxylate/amino acid:cation symporter [bacterium]HQJ63982.1 dicarboxylate/amino acid:cation symporter [bacterium]